MRLAFLGPVGTYGERAARRLASLAGHGEAELVPQQGIRAVIQSLAQGQCELAVVPVENSVEGGVTAALEALGEHPALAVEPALVLPIRPALAGSGPLAGISEVLSHPQALAQCSLWLAEHLPQALQLPTSSTAEAARMVRGSRFRGAIASLEAAAEHQLEVLAYPINDVPGNCTRFLLLRRGPRSPEGPLASLAFSLHSNQPGALLEALSCFARQGLNMGRIESRPSKREMGEYVFFVDLELPTGSATLERALSELAPLCEHLALFGAYPLDDLSAAEETASLETASLETASHETAG
ncbi:MAG: prephenate dehydratase [Synechococcaceae cyanobacterium]